MVISTNREVTLSLGVKTTGAEGLANVAEGLRDIGKEAAAGAPGVEHLANDVSALAARMRESKSRSTRRKSRHRGPKSPGCRPH